MRYIRFIINCLPFLLVFATIFVVNKNLVYSMISGKYFWFYGVMGLVSLTTLITIIFNKRGFRFSVLDWVILLFTGNVYLSALVLNEASQNATKLTLLALLTVLYFCFRLIPKDDKYKHLFCIFIVISGLVETIWGILQLYGFTPSQHHLFNLTGSLFNPGPYGGYLAVVFPVSLYYCLHPVNLFNRIQDKSRQVLAIVIKWLSGITCFAIIMVLPAAMSRASWLALIAGSIVVVYMYYERFPLKEYYLRYKKLIRIVGCVAVLILFAAFVGMYILKKNSADGRILTWKISVQAAIKHPLGVGLGNFVGVYGDEQATYFASGKANATEELVAGSPEFGFNEYLQVLTESGIVAFLLFMTIIVLTFRAMIKKRDWGLLGSLISMLVFAFFSYPFNVLPFLIILMFLFATSVSETGNPNNPPRLPAVLISCLCVFVVGFCLYKQYYVYEDNKQWNHNRIYYHSGLQQKVASDYETLYSSLNDQPQFLFEYAQVLAKSEEYEKSNEVLQRAMQISCEPMLYNMMGKNYQAMKEYDQAEAAFLKAANLVPNRLYPWYLLTKLYDEMSLKDKVYETAAIVQTKEPKVLSPAVTEMREEVEKLCEGTNRSVQELEKVLNHYKENPADSLKYRAASFLIENMSIHYYLRENAEYFDIMDSLNRSDLKNDEVDTRFDAIKKQTVTSPRAVFKDESLPSEFLIAHIDKSFANWESAPWKAEVGFEDFCEYILPYAVATEKRELWTDYYREQYRRYLSGYTSGKTMADICNMLNDSLKFHNQMIVTLTALQNYPPLLTDNIRSGTCDNYASRTIYIMRSLGIPVGKDFVPQWGNYMVGHSWNTLLAENGRHYPFVGFGSNVGDWDFDNRFNCSKVYRNTYSIQKNSIAVRYTNEQIPNFLKQRNMKDVTAEYLPVSDVKVSVKKPSNIRSEVAYLCVFNNTTWIPVHWGAVDDNKVTFTDMGREVVYLPAFYDGKNFVAANNPFILDSLGNMHLLEPHNRKKETLVLERKFHTRRLTEYYDRMINGRFQGANKPDFSDVEDLYVVTQRPKTVFNTAEINNAKSWRYVRYIGVQFSYCNVAEIEFYSNQSGSLQKLLGKVIGSEGSYNNKPGVIREDVFDGDPLTYLTVSSVDSGIWVGLDLGKQEQIARIRYLPRNDDNNIRPGDEYELFYWDKGQWNSLGKQTGTDKYVLRYDNCPSNTLFLLHNHTRGKEERIFTYENGKQKWW